MHMFEEQIDNDYIVMQGGTSEGTQIKYRKDGFWYKKDNRGREGLAEYLASGILGFSTLNPKEYVRYEMGNINGHSGCRSRNFLLPDEELVTFYRLYYNEMGKDLSQVTNRMDEMEERIEYVINFINQSVNWCFPIEENVKRVVARPFSGSHERMVNYLGMGFELNWENALKWLENEPESIERNVLIYQMQRYRGEPVPA